jgi:hypothetical protein
MVTELAEWVGRSHPLGFSNVSNTRAEAAVRDASPLLSNSVRHDTPRTTGSGQKTTRERTQQRPEPREPTGGRPVKPLSAASEHVQAVPGPTWSAQLHRIPAASGALGSR